jgi:polysaccharide export outer membrane protein
MKPFFSFKFPLLLLISVLFFSCASRKEVVYYQNIDKLQNNENGSSFETRLKVDDLLMIIVLGETPEIAEPFNLPLFSLQSNTESSMSQQRMPTYLIDSSGNIQFPVLGQLHLAGLTRAEATSLIDSKLLQYIKKPNVNMRILNYKVSVQGEVKVPGIYTITSERVTLIEALSLAGDLTVYGKRNNILILREVDGKKQASRVDITSADFINSPFYYLTQNDVVYVEPNKTKVNSSVVGPNAPIIISSISILITLIALLIRK